jgi:hypothetical protein
MANNGRLALPRGKLFPERATAPFTGVTTASTGGLTGGGISGTLNLALTNKCAANEVVLWNGMAWLCSSAGTGTITRVSPGTDLTAGGISGSVTLNLDTTKVLQLAATNTFTGNQTVNGNWRSDIARRRCRPAIW